MSHRGGSSQPAGRNKSWIVFSSGHARSADPHAPQCDTTIAKLDECLALFEEKPGLLNGAELRAKSLLLVIRNELMQHAAGDAVVPFE
jgi:hypothetical protein